MQATHSIQIITALVAVFLLSSQSSAERGIDTGNMEKRIFIPMLTCPHPPSVKDGTLSCSTTTYLINTQCHLACHSTFTPSHPTVKCTYHAELRKSIWNASPSCTATRCAKSPTTPHGSYQCPSSIHTIGQVCSLTCSTGYRYSSTTHTATCHTGGVWSTSATCLDSCPRGSYEDVAHSKCHLCPVGTYQDHENSQECVPCSWGLSTAAEGSTNSSSCRSLCQPGTSSSDGLVPCSSCRVGSYQGMPGSKSCDLCPQGQTTRTTGAMEIQDCMMM